MKMAVIARKMSCFVSTAATVSTTVRSRDQLQGSDEEPLVLCEKRKSCRCMRAVRVSKRSVKLAKPHHIGTPFTLALSMQRE